MKALTGGGVQGQIESRRREDERQRADFAGSFERIKVLFLRLLQRDQSEAPRMSTVCGKGRTVYAVIYLGESVPAILEHYERTAVVKGEQRQAKGETAWKAAQGSSEEEARGRCRRVRRGRRGRSPRRSPILCRAMRGGARSSWTSRGAR